MNQFKNKSLHERGDTIVEVLIAIAIVSLILVGAFVTSRQSTAATRDAQEHAEALQILKGQVEEARIIYANSSATQANSNPLVNTKALFCIDDTGANSTMPILANLTSSSLNLPPAAVDDFTNYPLQCQKGNNSYKYYIAIENGLTNTDPILSAGDTLVFHARWDNTSGGRDEVTLTYRGHSGS